MKTIKAPGLFSHPRLVLGATIVVAEASFLIAAYGFEAGSSIEHPFAKQICGFLGGNERLCAELSDVIAITFIVSVAVVAWIVATSEVARRSIASIVEVNRRPPYFLAMHFAGVAAVSAPWLIGAVGFAVESSDYLRWLWPIGVILAACGLLLWLFETPKLVAVAAPALLIAALSLTIILYSLEFQSQIWVTDWAPAATFHSVGFLLSLFGQTIHIYPVEELSIGIGAFRVQILSDCSGLSGVMLVTSMTSLYIVGFRRSLRVGRALLLIPTAIVASWVLNVCRISALILIGEYLSQDLAVNAFHSYAGWLIFTLLSAVLLLVAESSRFFHKDISQHESKGQPFVSDRAVAEILPFVVLLVSGIAASAFFSNPEIGYFLIFTSLLVCGVLFFPVYRFIPFSREKHLSVLCGLAVAGLWLSINERGEPLPISEILAAASPSVIVLWCAMRVAGTTIFVPVIEEMFFRSYLLRRLDVGTRYGKFVALALSSLAFAVLHGDWLAAFIAGLLFGALVIRSGKLGDAVLAHVIANGSIATWALIFDDWSVI